MSRAIHRVKTRWRSVYADSCEAAQNNPNGYDALAYDLNNDCVVDFLDLAMYASEWAEDRRLITNETFE